MLGLAQEFIFLVEEEEEKVYDIDENMLEKLPVLLDQKCLCFIGSKSQFQLKT